MTSRKPNRAPQSEEELFEQWAFLDRLVERQAAQLRAGVQDLEEADEPGAGLPELEALRREVERLGAELARSQAAEREMVSRDLHGRRETAELTRRLGEMSVARERAERQAAEAAEALRRAGLEIESLRAQLAAGQHGFWRMGRH
ncbi:MAG: hypothetical protein ACLQT7_02435 [Candidatus Dormibacteria bacterium]